MQKEVEEEKQARVGQVSDLLGWVKGLQGRTGGPDAESSLAAQQVLEIHHDTDKQHFSTSKAVLCFLCSSSAASLNTRFLRIMLPLEVNVICCLIKT